ncbi:hypothetical protein RclHR1_08830012 [Rhizophagus clarus]|uniref:F-box domain-containing protein n=1 Tax=Rhizophagus clarus TaxID=94130 RepID=A0A2Z6SG83_9GLOM|nr:hypothetical protein RclHR1_08830012 [Rhizophagus clarus]GES86357.1 hypothetical protein GLOIN_2v1764020 [Rhizophagus clarus]
MSKLNKDILFLIFEELHYSSKILFSFLTVNKLWCETVIPILWRRPWHYAINYCNKNSLYSIITSYLPNNVKEFLTKGGIQISYQTLAFDYLFFCRSIDVKIIDEIISIGSSTGYNLFLLQEEIYSLLIKKCQRIKYLYIYNTNETIVYHPDAKVQLESLCELICDTSIKPEYFYKLAHVCQRIQSIIVINKSLEVNHGITKLVEFQKNLKCFKWLDDIYKEYYMYQLKLEDPYTEIFNILKKHGNTLNEFVISLQFDYGDSVDNENIYNIYNAYDYTFLQYTLLELHNLKLIDTYSPIFLKNDDFNKKLEMIAYDNLEILDLERMDIYQATCIMKNSSNLRELWIREYYWDNDKFNDDTLNFIRTIYENCILIEYLAIPVFPLLESHLIEFEKLLKKCQKLRSLDFKGTYCDEDNELEYGDYLANVITREASKDLRDIDIPYNIKFSLEALETFLEKWKGRPAISINIEEPYSYESDDSFDSYKKIIDKYKNEGVIKLMNI